MRFLITGATGFIGQYVTSELLSQGHSIIALVRNISKAECTEWYRHVEVIQFDYSINKIDSLEAICNPDRVIHLAWNGLPNYNSLHHIEEELNFQYKFIKSIIEVGIKDILIAGTCFEYGKLEGELKEERQTTPDNSYSIAKHSLYLFLMELKKTKSFQLKWARLFYMYGRGQAPSSLYSSLLDALENNKESFDMSLGDQIRDFLPIEDIAKYLISVSLQNREEGIINIGSGNGQTVLSFVENILYNNNKKIKLNLGVYPYSQFEAHSFWANIEKLKRIIENGSH